MTTGIDGLFADIRRSAIRTPAALALIAMSTGACGGGGNGGGNGGAAFPQSEIEAIADCNPADPATFDECGTLMVGLTDADGEFLSYTVDVLSLILEKADGAVVEVLPRRTRMDFAQYVDLTEFISVATVPPGVYTAVTIQLDYSNAEVLVEVADLAQESVVQDTDGNPLGVTSMRMELAQRDRLLVSRATTSLLTIDFDLDASHTVDVTTTPAVVVAEPFIVAEIDPVDFKQFRVRGRFQGANEEEMYYLVALRPFYDRVGDFGHLRVYVTEQSDCEIDEAEYSGVECLRALEAAGPGTLTVAHGTLQVADRMFTASFIVGGTSVPGNGMDAASGQVISRLDNELLVRGGTVLMTDALASFSRDDVRVTVGPNTKVYKTYRFDRPDLAIADRLLDVSAISVGQSVAVRGAVVENDESGIHIDATEGAVVMHVTHLNGIVNTVNPGQVDIDLYSLGGRRPGVYDFTCTGGCEPSTDADPDNYEISTGSMLLDAAATGQAASAWGFVNPFTGAPPDFEARTLVSFTAVRSSMAVGWGRTGTQAPFLMMDGNGLTLDNQNESIAGRHFIRKGPILIDFFTLDSATTIVPREIGPRLFVIKTTDSLQIYADFDEFVAALQLLLDGANSARTVFARGFYNPDTNIFDASKIFIHILEQ